MIKNSIKEYETCLEESQKKGNRAVRHGGKTGSLMDAAAVFAASQELHNKQEEQYMRELSIDEWSQPGHFTIFLMEPPVILCRNKEVFQQADRGRDISNEAGNGCAD